MHPKRTGQAPAREDPRVTRTREKVLRTAYELLTEIGFGNVTVDHISERSGVSRSVLYRHWDSRDEILRDAFSAVALTIDADSADLREGLRCYARAITDGLRSVWGRAAVSLAVSALDDPAQRDVHFTFVRGFNRDIAHLVELAVERGELVEPVDVEDVATQLVAPLFFRYLFSESSLDDGFATQQADRVYAALTDRPGEPGSVAGGEAGSSVLG